MRHRKYSTGSRARREVAVRPYMPADAQGERRLPGRREGRLVESARVVNPWLGDRVVVDEDAVIA
jgi:hypothetical protein